MWSTYGFMLYILLCIFSKYGQGYRRPDAREFYDPRKPSNWNPKRIRPRGQSRAKPSNLYSLVPAGDGQYFKLAPISAPDDGKQTTLFLLDYGEAKRRVMILNDKNGLTGSIPFLQHPVYSTSI
ncbi:unnamed protein product [Plutella xylostella]|uniref:(diamondback moth) hypothetical protein n=1 Tax=Plutella xylostella TaxID=51655 RepID=A0A8S4G1V5_PLUXY|nr:unnamed protein product [Plutella xylostella]